MIQTRPKRLRNTTNLPSWTQLSVQPNVTCNDDDFATPWLDDESVRTAIHALPKSVIGHWEQCTRRVNYTFSIGDMIPYQRNLTTQAYRALIYSGDHDMVVPFTGSEAWTRSLGYKIIMEFCDADLLFHANLGWSMLK